MEGSMTGWRRAIWRMMTMVTVRAHGSGSDSDSDGGLLIFEGDGNARIYPFLPSLLTPSLSSFPPYPVASGAFRPRRVLSACTSVSPSLLGVRHYPPSGLGSYSSLYTRLSSGHDPICPSVIHFFNTIPFPRLD